MPQPGINLLPEQQVRQKKVNPVASWFFKTGIYFLLGTYILVLAAFGFRWYQDSKISALNSEIDSTEAEIASKQDIVEQFKVLQSQYGLVSQVYAEVEPRVAYLNLVEETIPEPIRLTKFEVQDRVIEIVGRTLDYLAINEWQNTLSKHTLTQDVVIKTLDRRSPNETNVTADEAVTEDVVEFILEIPLPE